MPWIQKHSSWLPKNTPAARREQEAMYTITEVARIFKVSRTTVYKWLDFDDPEEAVIHPNDWFKIPTGHIRIRRRAVEKLMQESNP